MEITTKNKEEIEKIKKGCNCFIRKMDVPSGDDGEFIDYDIHCGEHFVNGTIELCPVCRRAKQERIKTSILFCETIKEIVKKYEHLQLQPLVQELKEFEIHLTYLKEQEKKYDFHEK